MSPDDRPRDASGPNKQHDGISNSSESGEDDPGPTPDRKPESGESGESEPNQPPPEHDSRGNGGSQSERSHPEGTQSKSGGNTNSKTECLGELVEPTPGSWDSRREFAIRRYYGLGEDGEFIEEWSQQKIADHLGVSRQTVNKWVNSEVPTVEDWSQRERWTLYSLIMSADEDAVDEYLYLRELESRASDSPTKPAMGDQSDEEPHLFDGLDDEGLW